MSTAISFRVARAKFIEAYSQLESCLSRLIQALLEVDSRISWSLFYRVSNTRARYAIIDDVFKIKHPELRKAWSVIERWLRAIDTARNHIVHWMEVQKPNKAPFLANPVNYMDMETLCPDEPDTELKYTEVDFEKYSVDAYYCGVVIGQLIIDIKKTRPALHRKFLELINDRNLEEFAHTLTD